ncbi:MAG TPA: FAD-dependent monooxygenase [Candidatus Limnocylindrales bacterium]|nr:FAD-dependent monooxygenase [Candidatus Limnocylindrales bacterium]
MKRAAIIGGGIGGLTTAIALRKIGFEVNVYERATELKEIGSGMSLWPNAVRSLQQIDPEILARLATPGRSLRRMLMKDEYGERIKTLPLPSGDCCGIAIHRAELQSALAASVPSHSIHLGHTFSSLQQRSNSVFLQFKNGASAEADLVVACDGIHSAVRESLGLKTKLSNRYYSVWRGVTNMDPEPDAAHLGLEHDGDFSESYGPGRRFGILRLGPGRIHWYAAANHSLLPPRLSERAALQELFAGWHAPIPELIANSENAIATKVQDRLSTLPWVVGRVAILGDAAHPISPNFGQGACLAIEDAVVLAASLQSHTDLPRALRRYELARYPRCLEILFMSREAGRFAQFQNRTLVHLRKHFIKLAPLSFTTFWFRRSCDFRPPSLATSAALIPHSSVS